MKIILFLLFPILSFSQIMSPNKMLLRTPIWSVLELNDKNSNYLQPGNEVTVKFQNKSTCIVEVSRVVKKIALVDISECERVIEINQLIPKSAKIKREYSPVWYRPITGLEKKLFPLNKDTPLIVGRLRSQVVINILERTNYKSYYGKEFQFWYKVKTKDLVGWLPDESLVFDETNNEAKRKDKIKKLKISLVTPKRKNKYDKGMYLNTNAQIQINNVGEVGTTSKSNLGYEQISFLTGGIEAGYITELSNQAYMFDFYYSHISNSVNNSTSANMWGTFDLGYKMKSGMVPFMGVQYETLKSYNVDSLSSSSDTKVIVNNSLIWFRVGFENKIFSLRDIAYSLGLHRTPFAKNLFRMLDHSFYFKIVGSYASTSSSDNNKAFSGTKFYAELNSRLFNDILFGAFYQITTLLGQTEYSAQRLGVSIGYSFY